VTADFLFVGADGIDPVNGSTTFNEGYAISAVMAKIVSPIPVICQKTAQNLFKSIL
jgi:DeoR family galactitol utilization operon repressor